MDYKQLVIRGISYSQTQSGAYALLLEHEQTNVKLPVVIGNFEAQSISLGLEKDIQTPRPLTHDLFAQFIKETSYSISSILIYQIIDGVFFSQINLNQKDTKESLVLDARTSDAVAMAVRFNAPIYTTQEVLNEAGILLEIENHSSDVSNIDNDIIENGLNSLSIDDLEKLLEEAVAEEDFDAAMEIQEEINKRRKKID